MDYHMESKLATIAFKFQELEQELNEIDGGITWNELAINYTGHPLKNIDEYIDDVKAGVYDDDSDDLDDEDDDEDDDDENVETCGWYEKKKCGDCKGTRTDWIENCKRDDELNRNGYHCEACSRGIMYPAFGGILYCRHKCHHEVDFAEYKAKHNK